MGGALLHGEIGAAFLFNPLAFIGLAVLTVLGLAWTVEVAGGPKLRWPSVVAGRLAWVRPTHWLILFLAISIVFTVLRNLL